MFKANNIRFISKLREHIGFIQRSCAAYDQGVEEEAIRISTSLRVIFHNKGRNKSLVSHLGLGDKSMLSSSQGHGDWKDYLAIELNLSSPQPVRMLPLLGNKLKQLSMEDWWDTESVFVHDAQRYSRRKIILSVTDKDGGAHVDEELEKYYEYLCGGEHALGITGNLQYNGEAPFQQGVTLYPTNTHLALIRQFAHETLMSAVHYGWLENGLHASS